jgi:transcriptional regulator
MLALRPSRSVQQVLSLATNSVRLSRFTVHRKLSNLPRQMSNFYIPKDNVENDPAKLQQIMLDYPLATLVVTPPPASELSSTESYDPSPIVSYIPLIFDQERMVLKGHVARANPLVKINKDQPVSCMTIFHGPDGYISPAWYETKKTTGKAVPTWNFIVVHAHGKLNFIQDRNWIYENVAELSDRHEATRGSEWKITDAPPTYIDAMIRAIIGIEISVDRMEGKFKLSQNRSDADRKNVIEELAKSSEQNDRDLAEWMMKSLEDGTEKL